MLFIRGSYVTTFTYALSPWNMPAWHVIWKMGKRTLNPLCLIGGHGKTFFPPSLWLFICFPGSPTHDRYGSGYLSVRHYHISSNHSGTLELSRIMRGHAARTEIYTIFTYASLRFICSSISPKCPQFKCCVLANRGLYLYFKNKK